MGDINVEVSFSLYLSQYKKLKTNIASFHPKSNVIAIWHFIAKRHSTLVAGTETWN